ncbi:MULTISPECIES: class I SAM-dependent methyltransferase [Moorena]|uniref:Methylase involved in ubiquinone/menaquinone biosynthesis n=1 Tax=Moorena producens 3L TaxID=489825 RepID=F4XZD0_9CYAN|nr:MULTISPECIES: class I SAM-dependent methyltransferase [Moorena]NEQ16090.1 class I SAM-dependent methyltransferase [Moorena sp. SIO3E2]EGJ30050.1 methylase involved in ubiquinone/menaquinone biosynthesis [Moorena producens 3L]NEP66077.1 class I SAM-dependent methyltransferase [Moorena sp. SIO3A5]NER87947.1 class I SAM-dependent methyltransferase [Moorena sp. SIO3A2]NES41083.1 class I SAM-dependent methyltransferase [Moorena sp. SIO2C4]
MKDSKDFYEGMGLKFLEPQNQTEGIREYMELEDDFILRTFKGVDSVLDVGCGEGRYVRKLAPIVGKITGIDFSEQLVALAKDSTSTFNNVTILAGRAEHLTTLVQETFTYGLLAWNTIGNIPQQLHQAIFDNLAKVVDKKVFISTFKSNQEVMDERLRYYDKTGFKVESIDGNQVILEGGLHHANAYPFSYFQELLESAGFSMETHDLGWVGVMIEGTKK